MLGGKRLYITAAEANANIMVPLFRTVGRALKVLEDSSLGVSVWGVRTTGATGRVAAVVNCISLAPVLVHKSQQIATLPTIINVGGRRKAETGLNM